MSAGGSNPPNPRGLIGEKGNEKKSSRSILKITVSVRTPGPITSPSPTNVNIPNQLGGVVRTSTSSPFDVAPNMSSQAREVLTPVSSSPSVLAVFAPLPSPTVPSTSPLPEVSPL